MIDESKKLENENNDENKEKPISHLKVIKILNQQNILINSLLDFLCFKGFYLKDSCHKKYFLEVIETLNSMLDGGNLEI